jgi:tetratricopeptide (TPR) repeat protein
MPLTRTAWGRLLAGGLIGALAASAAAAPKRSAPAAEPRDPRAEKIARAHFDKAEKGFNLGRFAEALGEYEAAYEALPLAAFVFNIAQCHRNLGNDEQAVFFYQRFLALQPDTPNRAVVEGLIAEQTRRGEARQAAQARATMADAPTLQPVGDDRPPDQNPGLGPRSLSASETATLPADQRLPAPPTRGARLSPRWWLFGVLGAAVLGTVAVLVLRPGGTPPSGKLGVIETR